MSEINWKSGCWVTTVFLVNTDKKVLLSWNKNVQNWVPVGGHMNPGETPEEAIKREVEEETGFDFEFFPKMHEETNGTVKVLNERRIQIEKVPHHGFHMNVVFFGKCKNHFARDENDDNEKLKWFSKEEIMNEEMNEEMIESVKKLSLEAIEEYEKN